MSDHLVYHQSWIPTLAGIGGAVLTSALSALIAARGMTRIRPVEALPSDSSPEPWVGVPRLVVGLLVLAGAVALAIVTALVFDGPIAASTAEPSALLWALALGLLAPLILRPLVDAFAPVAAWVAPRTGRLAAQTVRGRGPRSAGIVIPLMLATSANRAATSVTPSHSGSVTEAAPTFASSLSSLPAAATRRSSCPQTCSRGTPPPDRSFGPYDCSARRAIR